MECCEECGREMTRGPACFSCGAMFCGADCGRDHEGRIYRGRSGHLTCPEYAGDDGDDVEGGGE